MTHLPHVSAALLALALVSGAGAGEVSLAATPETGQTASFVYTNELLQAPTGQFGQPFHLNYTLEFDTKVAGADERYTDVEVRFSRIAIDSTLGVFDSKEPAEGDGSNLVAQAFRPAVGDLFKVRLDTPTMRVIGITGPDDAYVPDMMIRLYERVLGENMLSESLQPMFRLKSEPPTAEPGETWTRTIMRHANVGRIEIRLDITLAEIEDETASIDIAGEHLIRLEQDTPVSQRMVDQLVEGQATWSLADELLRSFTLEKTFTLAAGDENLDLGAKIREREHLERAE